MTRLGMIIDLKRCILCESCSTACKSEKATPPDIFYRRVLNVEIGKYPFTKNIILPVQCMHCRDPPCLKACPSGAISQRPDGIVLIDDDKCVGCRLCITECPYGAISFYEDVRGYYPDHITPYEEVRYKEHKVGVVGKCDFCAERLDMGWKPACVQTCPTEAIHIGDLDDPNSEVSKLIKDRRGWLRLYEEYNTDPSVYYLL
ncbi:MAG: 4Fe-4S dicluster domain-containing protein [Candidatus Bathyarchaeia archaeon]